LHIVDSFQPNQGLDESPEGSQAVAGRDLQFSLLW